MTEIMKLISPFLSPIWPNIVERTSLQGVWHAQPSNDKLVKNNHKPQKQMKSL